MLYNITYITQEDIERAKTELLYSIACAKQSGVELLCCCIDIKNEKMISKIVTMATRVLKQMKQDGRISLFLNHETFLKKSVQTEYLFNKHPALQNDEFLNSSKMPYLFIRL